MLYEKYNLEPIGIRLISNLDGEKSWWTSVKNLPILKKSANVQEQFTNDIKYSSLGNPGKVPWRWCIMIQSIVPQEILQIFHEGVV